MKNVSMQGNEFIINFARKGAHSFVIIVPSKVFNHLLELQNLQIISPLLLTSESVPQENQFLRYSVYPPLSANTALGTTRGGDFQQKCATYLWGECLHTTLKGWSFKAIRAQPNRRKGNNFYVVNRPWVNFWGVLRWGTMLFASSSCGSSIDPLSSISFFEALHCFSLLDCLIVI